ncbi:MAG: tetratricopeptide repeat protein [bacterium]|nr:MAG: tetratricopeptide repeat protein [bacterium]
MKTLVILLAVVTSLSMPPVAGNTREEIDPRALSAYLKGAFFEARHDLANAFRFYILAERFDPENRRIRLKTARIALQLGDLEQAESRAEGLTGGGVDDIDAQLLLAEIEYRRGEQERALERLKGMRAVGEYPRLEVLKFLAKINMEIGKTQDAREVLEEAEERYPGDFFVHFRLGFIRAEAGEIDQAIDSFERAVAVNPGFANAYLALASLLKHAERVDEAKRAYRSTLEIEPDNRQALLELAELLYREGEFTQGVDLLEPRLQEGKLDNAGTTALGRFYYRVGRTEDALRLFMELLEELGEVPMLMRVIAEIEIDQGALKTAYGRLRRLVEIEPDLFNNYIGLVLILGGLAGEPASPEEAVVADTAEVEHYLEEAAKRIDANSLDENYLLGTVYRKYGNLAEAERYLLRAEGINNSDRSTLLELATLYESRREYDKALTRVIRIYEKDTENASILNFYGYLLAEKGEQLDLAEELLTRALSKEPDNGYFLDSMGWIKFKKGDFTDAAAYLERAISKAGDDAVIWEHLGETYERLGREREAIEAYEKSLELDPGKREARENLDRLMRSDIREED